MRDTIPTSTSETVAATDGNAAQWRNAAIAVTLCLIVTLAWYGTTAMSMVEVWRRSDTFAHGFIVLPISLWLVWSLRHELAVASPRPAWWTLPFVALTGFVWLLGELTSANAVTQLALVALLVFSVSAVLGTAVARKLVFPLGFLFFAVPVGEFMMPRLMEWTADVTVLGLRLSGVPVYREGQQFVIPTGHWSVVEACSGVRYLIASLVVGTLFAYLTYRSWRRRAVFVAVALVVPIAANWLRAYMIVMLGHVSGNTIAAGVDHLIYGWLFFGIVIAALFWIGVRWREDQAPLSKPPRRDARAARSVSRGQFAAAAVCVVILGAIGKLGYWAIERSDAARPPILSTITAVGDWQAHAESPVDWRPGFQNPAAASEQTYRKGDHAVMVSIRYYRNQDYTSKLLSSENVLVRSADPVWARVTGGLRTIDIGGTPLQVQTAELRGRRGERLLAWQWYWINGRVTANDYLGRAYIAVARVLGRGDDSAAVIVSAIGGPSDGADEVLASFVSSAMAPLNAALLQTRDQR